MYLIVEGMSSSGKTAFSKYFANKQKCAYFKSLLPSDDFGDLVRNIRDSGKDFKSSACLHMADLFRNELQIIEMLKKESVVRDKSFLSSLSFLLTNEECFSEDLFLTLKKGYGEVYKFMTPPDCVIFLKRNYADIRELYRLKMDKSKIDEELLAEEKKFTQRQDLLIELARKYYSPKLMILNSMSSLEEAYNKVMTEMKK